MSKRFVLPLALAVLALVALIIYVVMNLKQTSYLPPQGSTQPQVSPTPNPINLVIYPQQPSPDGRDIYYQIAKSYPGAGYYPMTFKPETNAISSAKVSTELTSYIVGSFVSWEDISRSSDKYLVLKSNIPPHKDIPLPKIRVGFNKDLNAPGHYSTGLGVEDLSTIIPTIIDSKGARAYSLGYIVSFTPDELAKLIRPNDAIVVTALRDFQRKDKKVDLIDGKSVKIAEWLYIRRFDPKNVLPKELGREINFK